MDEGMAIYNWRRDHSPESYNNLLASALEIDEWYWRHSLAERDVRLIWFHLVRADIAGEVLNLSEIEQRSVINRHVVRREMEKAERAGLVVRLAGRRDARKSTIHITPKGHQQMLGAMDDLMRRCLINVPGANIS